MAKLDWSRPKRDMSHRAAPSSDPTAAYKPPIELHARWATATLVDPPRTSLDLQTLAISDAEKGFLITCANTVRKGTKQLQDILRSAPKKLRAEIDASGGVERWISSSEARSTIYQRLVRGLKKRAPIAPLPARLPRRGRKR